MARGGHLQGPVRQRLDRPWGGAPVRGLRVVGRLLPGGRHRAGQADAQDMGVHLHELPGRRGLARQLPPGGREEGRRSVSHAATQGGGVGGRGGS